MMIRRGRGSDTDFAKQSEEQTFEYADFTANVLTITHSIGRKNVIVQIIDENSLVTSFDVTLISTNQFTISTYGSFTGTYTVIIL